MDCTDAVLATVLVLSLGCYGNVLGSRSLMPPNGFHLVVQGDRLDVKLAELTVLSHSPSKPAVYLGKRSPGGGNKYERIILGHFETEQIGNDIIVTFSDEQNHEVEVQMFTSETNRLLVDFKPLPAGFDRIWIRIEGHPDERIFGGGEQFMDLNLKGKKIPIWTGDIDPQKLNITATTTHATSFPQPSFFTSRNYYCHVGGYNYMELDFTHPDYNEIFILGQPQTLYFNIASSTLETLRKMTYYLQRRQQDPPFWFHQGVTLSTQGDWGKIDELLLEARQHKIRVSSVWLSNWSRKVMNNVPKDNEDTDAQARIDNLWEHGVQVLGTINPYIYQDSAMFMYANEKNYLIKNLHGAAYIVNHDSSRCGLVDLTHPDAFEWFKGVIKRSLLDLGFSGWFAESANIPVDAVFHNGESGATVHNHYAVLLTKANWQAIEEAEMFGKVMFFMKAGSSISSKFHMLTWIDEDASQKDKPPSFTSTISASLSLGISGFGLTHFDITRSHTGQSPESMLRRAEAAVFSSAMRIDADALMAGTSFSEQHLQRLAVFVEMFHTLANYTRPALLDYRRSGFPLQRPLFLYYNDDPFTYSINDQFLYGRDLLVAPVTEADAQSRMVYLPMDEWVYLYNSKEIPGPQYIKISAPLGRMPIFYRKSSKWESTFKRLADIANSGWSVDLNTSWQQNIPQTCSRSHCDEL